MTFWLGLAAREARDQAGLIRSEIAGPARVSDSAIRGFETGRSAPRELDAVVNAYVELAGLRDWRELYERALMLSRERQDTEPFEHPIRQAAETALGESPSRSAPKRRSRQNSPVDD